VEERVWSVLRGAFPTRLLSVPAACLDGFPFEVTVHCREPYRGVRARCNLGDGLELIRAWTRPGRSWGELAGAVGEAGRPLAPVFRLGFVLFEMSVASARDSAEPAAPDPAT
jgi:hypothetical protein